MINLTVAFTLGNSIYAGHRGRSYEWERIKMRDPETGVIYLQLTNASVHSQVLYFENQNFTADNRSLLFQSQRFASRDSGWDLFRVDVDGSNLVQLSDEEHTFASPIPSPNEARIIYGTRGNALLALNIDTFEEREIAICEEASGLGASAMTGDGTYFLSISRSAIDGKSMIVRFRTDGSGIVTFCHGIASNHLTSNYNGTILAFNTIDGHEHTCDIDGNNLRKIAGSQQFAHCSWLGKTDLRQGCLLPPGHAIATASVDSPEKTIICNGPYFWHSGSSLDGEWIISDTNWPDLGLIIVHVPSGRYTTLVRPRSRIGNQGMTHPHPSLNRDATAVVFCSNQTGLSQVYLCEIPNEIADELKTGDLNYRLRWNR